MLEVAWKTAAVIAGFSVFVMFPYDRAPSPLNWTPVTFVWAAFMVGSGLSPRSNRPREDESHEGDA